jgi:HD-like signal output (HDOD) protein
MNAVAAPSSRRFPHPALQALTERELTALFNRTIVRNLAAKTALFNAGNPILGDFLILEGTVQLRNPQSANQSLVVNTGEYLPATLLEDAGHYRFDCIAETPCKVLALERNATASLDEMLQVTLHKNLLPLTNSMLKKLQKLMQPTQGASADHSPAVKDYLNANQTIYQNALDLKGILTKLPRLPPYTTKLTSLLNNPEADTRTIIEIARQDPSLTASVLKTVNSPYYGLAHKVKDFQHAVMMLGFRQTQQLIMNTGVQSTMPNTPEFRQLQAHSMMISLLMSEISATVKIGVPVMLSTLGILHDIGKSVVLLLCRQHPKQEFFMSLLSADMVGMLLLKEWKLADYISDAVQYQSHTALLPPSCIPTEHRTNLAILHIAHCCLDRLKASPLEVGASDAIPPGTNKDSCVASYLAELHCPVQNIEGFLLRQLIPAIESRRPILPLALQDMLKKFKAGV